MKNLAPALCLAALVALSACAKPAATTDVPVSASDAATVAPPASASTSPEGAPATPDAAMPAMTPEQHAAMDAADKAHAASHDTAAAGTDMKGMDMKGGDMKDMAGVQAGWYRAGMLQACGSTKSMKVSNSAELDKQVKAGGMQPGDPVYVRLEGSMSGGALSVTRVAQFGSPTPVRDCAMTGVVTQSQ